MPVFPSLMRRMQQSSPAPTLFQGGMTPRQYEIQPDPPPARSSADKIRETVSSQLRYEDVAPKLEEIPQTPAFKPKQKYGVVDRLKMALGGAGLGSQRGGGLGAIGGIIAGLVNPEAIDRQGYAAYVKPQYDAEAQAAMGRNKARMGNFEGEMKARETISKINQANAPEWVQATGAAQTTALDKKSGQFKFATDEQGEPVEHYTLPTTRWRNATQKQIGKDNRKAAWDRLMETIAGREKTTQMNIDARKTLADIMNRALLQRLNISEGGQDRRLRTRLKAEGYDLSEGGSAGAGTGAGPARPGGGGTGTGTGAADTKSILDRLRPFLGLDDEEEENWWY